MGDRRGLELELRRLRELERELPPPPGEPKKQEKKPAPKTGPPGQRASPGEPKKKKKGPPKGGPPGQLGKPTPSATGSFEPLQETVLPAKK
jgi:hypothetical protein